MTVCGCEISAKEVRLAVVELNDEGKVEMLRRGSQSLAGLTGLCRPLAQPRRLTKLHASDKAQFVFNDFLSRRE